MKKDIIRQAVTLLVALLSVTGIYLVNAGYTALQPVNEVSGEGDRTNLTLPAGFSFGIWGVIYLGFLVYALCQALPSERENPHFRRAGYWIAASIFFNLLWTVLVGFGQTLLAYGLQWVMLFAAIVIMVRWGSDTTRSQGFERWLKIPFALYAGWLTVAMIPFTTSLLQLTGWEGDPLNPVLWAVLLYVSAVAIGYYTYRFLNDPWYLLPISWALFGIAVRFTGLVPLVAGAASLLVLVVMVGHLFGWWPGRTYGHS